MRSTWYLNALRCRICVTSALISLRVRRQMLWYCSCGKMISPEMAGKDVMNLSLYLPQDAQSCFSLSFLRRDRK